MARPHENEGKENEVIPTPSRASARPEAIANKISPNKRGKRDIAEGHANLHRRAPATTGHEKHIRIQDELSIEQLPASSSSGVYLGSFRPSPHHSRVSVGGGTRTPDGAANPSPRTSMGQVHTENFLQYLN